MKSQPYFKYYRFIKHDTSVTTISTNDFKPVVQRYVPNTPLKRVPESNFSSYTNLVQALEKAKTGAQDYIGELIKAGKPVLPQLLQYRIDHYEDLWFNLVGSNIRRLEAELKLNRDYQWKPYRILI